MAIFTYIADRNFQVSNTPVVFEAQFGDGYAQRSTNLINNIKKEWKLTFKNRTESDIATIIAFFEDTNSVTPFTWTPPGESTALDVVVTTWNKIYITNDYSSLSATFKRVYI